MVKPAAKGLFGVSLLLLGVVGCGGGGGGGATAEGTQFCHDYATAFCKKLYACPDPNVTISGTQADCVKSFATLCSQPPPQGITADVNCSAGQHVNTAARALCLGQYDMMTCDQFNMPMQNNLDICPDVCPAPQPGAAGSTGAAGSSGTAGTTGAAGNSGAPATRMAFCTGLNLALCRIEFSCNDPSLIDSTVNGTSAQQCVAIHNAAICSMDLTVGCGTYDSATAKLCLDELAILACSQQDSISQIPSCNAACMM